VLPLVGSRAVPLPREDNPGMTAAVPHPQGDREFGFPSRQPDGHPPGGDLVDVPVHDDIVRLPVEAMRQPVTQRVLASCRIAVSRQLVRSHRDMIPPAVPVTGKGIIQEEHFLRVPVVICPCLADDVRDFRDVLQLAEPSFKKRQLALVLQDHAVEYARHVSSSN
jgi:hypothetical protein